MSRKGWRTFTATLNEQISTDPTTRIWARQRVPCQRITVLFRGQGTRPRVRAAPPAGWEDERVERHRAARVGHDDVTHDGGSGSCPSSSFTMPSRSSPEFIPHDRFGLGRLTVLRREFPCAAGYIDLLLVDEFGRFEMFEVKKGTKNADVSHVIAQMLDYGAALWQTDIDAFETAVAHCEPRDGRNARRIRSPRNSGRSRNPRRSGSKLLSAWPTAISCSSTSVRDLDPRTERVVDYLTTRPKIPLFVMEVDNYRRFVAVGSKGSRSAGVGHEQAGNPGAHGRPGRRRGDAIDGWPRPVAWSGDPRVSHGPSVLLDAGRRLRERPPISREAPKSVSPPSNKPGTPTSP